MFLYDEKLHGKGMELEDVFNAAADCSLKAMYPDWLSLSGPGFVGDMYRKYGSVISPMGCRAFLSPFYERGFSAPADEEDVPVFTGRFNIGVVSLHLPMIYQKSVKEGKDFHKVLDHSSLLTAKTAWISAVEAVFLMFKYFFKYPHFLKSPSVIYVRRVKRLP